MPVVLSLLVLAAALGWALVVTPRAAAEPVAVSEGSLTWGVKESWRNYAGSGELSGGVTVNPDGTYRFPLVSGSFDDETDTTVLELAGQVRWRLYCGNPEPDRCLLDTTFRDLRVVIAPDEQVIRGTHVGYSQDDPGGELHELEDVVLGKVDIDDGEVSFDGGTSSWSGMRTLAGPGLFLYGEGTVLDRASWTYEGPGGMPDLGERWDEPGFVGLSAEGRHVSDYARGLSTESNRELFASADGNALHFAEIRGARSADTELRFTRLDPETLEVVGAPLVYDDFPTFNGNRYPGRYFRVAHDPVSDSLFLVVGGRGADELGVWVHRLSWDDDAGTYVAKKIGELAPAEVNDAATNVFDTHVGELVWNDVLGELAVVSPASAPTDVYDGYSLYRFREVGGDWQRTESVLRAPDGGEYAGALGLMPPWGYSSPTRTSQDWAVARDGSYITPSKTAWLRKPDPAEPGETTTIDLPSARIAIDGDQATTEYIDGTIAEFHPGYDHYYGWTSASESADGSVLIHNSQWGLESFVRVDVVDGAAEVVGDVYRTFDAYPPFLSSSLGRSVTADPVHGWDWVTDVSDPDGFTFNAFRRVDGEDELFSRHAYPEFATGYWGHATIVVDPHSGDIYVPILDEATDRFGYQRFVVDGVLAEPDAQPEPATAALAAGEESETVGFRSTVTGGDPEPTRQWQVRRPGDAQFVDIDGETGELLEVEARRGMDGSEYRAVYDSPAGRIVSDAATLAVSYAPRVLNEGGSVTVTAGEDATVLVMPDGNPEPEVTWQRRAGGFWEEIDADSGDFEVDGGSLTVRDANVAMDGALFRARLVNEVGVAYSGAARLTVEEAVTKPVTFGSGRVDWGFAARWRCYVVGNVARGGIEVSGGVERVPGTEASGSLCAGSNAGSEALRFPVRGGSYDPATGRVEVDLGGSVRFWGHAHHGGDGTPQLDTRFSNLRLAIEGETGTLYADAVGATLENPEPVTREGVALVALDLSGATGPVPGEGGLDWTGIESALTGEGVDVFGSYPQGEPFDPISMSLVYGEPRQPDPDPDPRPESKPKPGPAPDPQPDPSGPAKAKRAKPAVKGTRGLRRVGRRRMARVAIVRCPAGAGRCRVRVQRWVAVRIGGRRYLAHVIVRRRVPAGARRMVRLRLPKAAAKRLTGRRKAIVRFRIAVTQRGGQTTRTTVRVRLARPRSSSQRRTGTPNRQRLGAGKGR